MPISEHRPRPPGGRAVVLLAALIDRFHRKPAHQARMLGQLTSTHIAQIHVDGRPMQRVLRSVQRVTDIMREITSASRERAAGIAQVTQTITQMDETTQ